MTKEEASLKMNNILTINEFIADELGIENYINLFPSPNKQVSWSIKIEEYIHINKYITNFTDETVKFLWSIDFLKYNSDYESYTKLVRPCVAQILYIIFYRVIRIFRLLNEVRSKEILLLNTRLFTYPVSLSDLYCITRDSWEFNQYIINQILFDCKRVDFPKKDLLYPVDYWDLTNWSNYKGFGKQIITVPKKARYKRFLTNPRSTILEKGNQLLLMISTFGNKVPVLKMGYNESFMIQKGLFWPLGEFCQLPQQLPANLNDDNLKSLSRNNLSLLLESHFFNGTLDLLRELKINSHNEKYLNNISTLFFNLYPSNLLENSKILCDWSVETLRKFKRKHYFTYDTAASDIAIYYNYAATKLGFKIWSQQHSAWGGYLANVPNIAELSIAGSDFYVTSGWTHVEPSLPSWKRCAIPISSPHYSEFKKNQIPLNSNKNVLLLTGEIYNFPTLPAGSHDVDNLWLWAENIKGIIQGLTSKDVNVILKNYAPRVDQILKQSGILKEWEKAGGNKLQIFDNIEKGSASKLFPNVSATIWDMPGGGFVESILMGVPAFSFWNNQFITCQPEAKDEITSLISAGILNESAKKMVNNVFDCVNNENWFNDEYRQQTINNFMRHYIKTDNSWKKEWNQILKTLVDF